MGEVIRVDFSARRRLPAAIVEQPRVARARIVRVKPPRRPLSDMESRPDVITPGPLSREELIKQAAESILAVAAIDAAGASDSEMEEAYQLQDGAMSALSERHKEAAWQEAERHLYSKL